MTSFVLKIIAMTTMFLDHFGLALFNNVTELNIIGRIAFPIFAFQITEGYKHTKNLKKYFLRLFIFAIISQIPFSLFTSLFTSNISLNIFFTLLFGLICIFICDKVLNSNFYFSKNPTIDILTKKLLVIIISTLIGIFAEICKFDYGFFGIAIIVASKKLSSSIIILFSIFSGIGKKV